MPEINVKWPGQYIAEDNNHRLVTDEQIEFWNSKGVIELTPTNFKDYVIDESRLFTYDDYDNTDNCFYNSTYNKSQLYYNIQPGKYRIKLGYAPFLDTLENAVNDDPSDEDVDINGMRYFVKPDWVELFCNTYSLFDSYFTVRAISKGYSNILECNTFGLMRTVDAIEYIEMEVFDWDCFDIIEEHNTTRYVYVKCVTYNGDIIEYNNYLGTTGYFYINGVQRIYDWNDATENGVYYSSYTAEFNITESKYPDNPSMHMPLPIDYDGIFNLAYIAASGSTITVPYIGKVTRSANKIIQELDIIPKNVEVSYIGDPNYRAFMASLGTKFIRYGFKSGSDYSWTGWYIMKYDLGDTDPNLTIDDFLYSQLQ